MSSREATSCEEALRLLSAYLDGELEDRTEAEIKRHLSTCKSCFSRSEFERRLKERLARSSRAEVSDELQDRVRGLIRKFDIAPTE